MRNVACPPLTSESLPTNTIAVESRSAWRGWEMPLLALFVLIVYFVRLADSPICGEESRWANAAREMIATGDWIVPRQQGEIFPERPPLGSWAMALVGLLRGEVDVWAVRLPSVIGILLITLGIFAYACTWMSRPASLVAALIFATTGQILQLGQLGESEALFTLFVAGSLLVWHAGYVSGRSPTWSWCLGYTLAALAALVKGPQAPVYFVSVCGVFLLLERNWRWLFAPGHALGLACFAAVVGAWFVPFAATNLSLVDDIWAGLAHDRFTTEKLGKHLLTFPFETLGCLLPWSPLLIGFAVPQLRRAIWKSRPQMKFLLVALAVTYPSVWLAAGARGRYFMPLYPCFAILSALAVEQRMATGANLAARLLWKRYCLGLSCVVAIGGAFIVVVSLFPREQFADLVQPAWFLLFWAPAAVVVSVMLFRSAWPNRQTIKPQWAVLALACFAGIAYASIVINIRVVGGNDLTLAAEKLRQQLPAEKLVSLGRVYHRFAFSYQEPIKQMPWPNSAAELPPDVEYFCFDRRPGDTPELRSSEDGRLRATTPGTLPFEWEEIADIPCDPYDRPVHSRRVIIGRVRRPLVAANSTTPPASNAPPAAESTAAAPLTTAALPAPETSPAVRR